MSSECIKGRIVNDRLIRTGHCTTYYHTPQPILHIMLITDFWLGVTIPAYDFFGKIGKDLKKKNFPH